MDEFTSGDGPDAGRRDTRRGFLRRAAGAALTVASAERAGAIEQTPAAQTAPLPRITLGGVSIARMVIGCNPIGGWSHQTRNTTLAMTDYFTLENTVRFLERCEAAGLDTWLTYWDEKPLKALKARWTQGSKLRPYFMGDLPTSGKLPRDVLEYRTRFHVHHGNVTDGLFRAGKQEQVHDFVKRVHDELGVPAGISAHNPDCIRYADEKGWEADFYQCCLYYVTRPKEEIRAKLGAAPLGEPFLDTDRETMLSVIRQVRKPCLAFKILGAGWHCGTDEEVEEAFRIALKGIKPTDGIIVGMWPKYKDEIAQNVALVRRYGAVRASSA